jgi:dTDP-glucose 4,6-dehydratase
MAYAFRASFGTPVVLARPFNTYGPRQSARAVIPTIITQLLGGARRIKLGSVHPTRDFNFVKDTVRGMIALAQADAAIGEAVNIGSNFEISIGDTARLIADIVGMPVEFETDAQRIRPEKSEVERLWADNAKLSRLAGWSPEYGGEDGLRRGLAETIAWFSEPENLAAYKSSAYNI